MDMPRGTSKNPIEYQRKAMRRAGIRWPGDDYSQGAYVFIPETHNVVRLMQKLDEPGFYLTEAGALYVEKKTARGIVQEVRVQNGMASVADESRDTPDLVRHYIALYVRKHGQVPNVLHISYEDLVQLGLKRFEVAEYGDAWGLTIVLEARGQKLSVDRRIEI